MERPNLFVCTETVASRLDVEHTGCTVRIVGVYLERAQSANSKRQRTCFYTAAKRDVILCAGAIVTPQILMLRYDHENIISNPYSYPSLRIQWLGPQRPSPRYGNLDCKGPSWNRVKPGK